MSARNHYLESQETLVSGLFSGTWNIDLLKSVFPAAANIEKDGKCSC